MPTNTTTPPLPHAVSQLKFAFGRRLLSRERKIRTKQSELQALRDKLAEDVRLSGTQGILSLVMALLEGGPQTKFELCDASECCAPGITPLLEELLDLFDGDDEGMDLWHVSDKGLYHQNERQ